MKGRKMAKLIEQDLGPSLLDRLEKTHAVLNECVQTVNAIIPDTRDQCYERPEPSGIIEQLEQAVTFLEVDANHLNQQLQWIKNRLGYTVPATQPPY